jgi:hypothetical protein
MTKHLLLSTDRIDLFRIRGKVLLGGGLQSDVPWALLVQEGGEGTMTFAPTVVQVSFRRWPAVVFAYKLSTNGRGIRLVSEAKGYVPPDAVAAELRVHRRVQSRQ